MPAIGRKVLDAYNNMETLEQKIKRVTKEEIIIEPYNPVWPQLFQDEKEYLISLFPINLIIRIEHFGSTSVPSLSAKPIIDMQIEVTSLEETRKKVIPILESQGYDYFWRPTWGDDVPPFYAWCIKRDTNGLRTHHIHIIEDDIAFAEHWDVLLFRDYLIEHPEIAKEYGDIKSSLSNRFHNDRVAYTENKTEFVKRVTKMAKTYYEKA